MKKQNTNSLSVKKEVIHFFVLTSIIVVSFIFLVPKITSNIIPQKNAGTLQSFITNTQSAKEINLQHYWEFREFYSPGYFIYERTGLSEVNTPGIESFTALDKQATPQLLFISQKVLSIGGRTKSKLLSVKNDPDKKIILKTHSVVLSEDHSSLYITFLKPITEVRKANGFLYHEPNNDKLFGEMWLEQTTIKKKRFVSEQ